MPVGTPHPIIPIKAMGTPTLIRLTQERTIVESCLQELQNVRYFMPNFSYFKIKQLEACESNVVLTTERLCTFINNMTFIQNSVYVTCFYI
jgi:hypothetical protein